MTRSEGTMTMRFAITVGVTMLVLAACTNSSETSTTNAPGTTEREARTNTSTTVIDTTTTTQATTTTEADAPFVPSILVAGEAGIVLIDGDRTSSLLDEPVSVAADDLMGGVVFQGPAAERGFGDPEDTIVWWLRDGAEAPQSLLVPTGDQRLHLMGVTLVDGSPSVMYVRRDNPGDFENAIDTLRLYDFGSSQVTEVRVVGGWEGGVSHVTHGGGVFASNWFGEAYSGFDFFDASGSDVDVAGDPYPADAVCFDGTRDPGGGPCYDSVAISADGERIAYTVLVRDQDGIVRSLDLVVADTDEATELYRVTLRTEEPFSVSSLELSGELVLYNQFAFVTRREALPATIVDLSTGRSASLSIPGTARFAPTLGAP